MQLRHVSTNLRQGLRRNLSMHAAVVLTLFVTLSLSGLGVLLFQQADLTEKEIGTELTMKVYLCVGGEQDFPQCTTGVTGTQEKEILRTIEENPEVDGYSVRSQEDFLETMKQLEDNPAVFEGPDPIVTVDDVPKEIRITLKNPKDFDGIYSELQFRDGVRNILLASDLVKPVFQIIDALRYVSWGAAGILTVAAVLLVANTIRLAALARRKEIEIMRLVGASRIFIALPFLLEALVTGLLGAALAGGSLAAFTKFVIIDQVDPSIASTPVIGWDEYLVSLLAIGIAGPVLTIVPTLLLTRKYLRL